MINSIISNASFILADSTQPQGGAAQNSSCMNSWPLLLIYVAIFGALYFIMIRPNSKKKKQEEQLKKNINIGDDITTIGGITGKVVAVRDEDDEVIIESGSDRVKLRFKKWCIYSNNTAAAAMEEEKKRIAEEKAKAKAEKKNKKSKDAEK